MATQKNKQAASSSSQTCMDDLPGEMLLHIISFLPTNNAAQTSVIAPKWRDLWHNLPVLIFNLQDFRRNKALLSDSEARQHFVEMVSLTLSQRPPQVPIQKLRLSFPCQDNDPLAAYVDLWLSSMIAAEADELDLNFSKRDPNHYRRDQVPSSRPYMLHSLDVAKGSFEVLKLTCCDLSSPPSPEFLPVEIVSLTELHLDHLSYNNEQIAHWLDASINLEILTLGGVWIEEDLKIESDSLRVFEFRGCDDMKRVGHNSVEICAPNLESFILHDINNAKYYLKDASSLVEAVVKFPGRSWQDFSRWTHLVSSLDGVERLSTQNMWCRSMFASPNERRLPGPKYKYDVVEEIFSDTFVFHNLKHVELLTGYSEDDIRGLETLLEKCPLLETMALVSQIYKYFKVRKNLPVVLKMPCLRLVKMKKFQKTAAEMFVVNLLKKHGRALETIVAYPHHVEGESRMQINHKFTTLVLTNIEHDAADHQAIIEKALKYA